jgi:hypothetical protein
VDQFVGAWRLESFTVTAKDGGVTRPLGDKPGGQIAYTPDGYMSAQLVMGQNPSGSAMSAYSGYFGPYTVDRTKDVVTHHVIYGSYEAMAGTKQERMFKFVGDSLTLSAVLDSGRADLVWRRYPTK